MFFTFTFVFSSCSLQEQEMSEKLTPTTEVKALIQSQGADDADLMRIPPTRGCNCYMKVLSANDVDWEEELWSVINVPQVSSGGDPLEINGHSETEWKRYLSDPSWSPLPSKYYLMNTLLQELTCFICLHKQMQMIFH